MAEGGFDRSNRKPKVQQLCSYYMHGVCKFGDRCQFVHTRNGIVPQNNVCRFYLKGNCSYGRQCRYDHVRPNHESNQRNSSPEPKIHSQHFTPSVRNQNQSRGPKENSRESSMVTLKMGGMKEEVGNKKQPEQQRKYHKNWVAAKDFIPGQKFHAGATYARAAHLNNEEDAVAVEVPDHQQTPREPEEKDLLCPYFAHGHCPYDRCSYIHGEVCDICQLPRLHPTDTHQREEHQKECLKEMEKDMEHSFDVQASQDKECCICLESILEKAEKELAGAAKSSSEDLFGILENCTHCFCLSCIRRWRSDKSFGKSVRACPICRVHSDFVTPSNIWVEDEVKKKKLIQDYKDGLSVKACRYFKAGKGHCPFNEKCFYKHAYPDGTIAKPKPRKPRRRVNADGESSVMDSISLWDFLEMREDGLISLEDELSLYFLGMLQDSDDEDGLFFGGWDSDVTTDSDSADFLF